MHRKIGPSALTNSFIINSNSHRVSCRSVWFLRSLSCSSKYWNCYNFFYCSHSNYIGTKYIHAKRIGVEAHFICHIITCNELFMQCFSLLRTIFMRHSQLFLTTNTYTQIHELFYWIKIPIVRLKWRGAHENLGKKEQIGFEVIYSLG